MSDCVGEDGTREEGERGGGDRDTTAYFTAQESPGVCVVTDTTKAAPNIELSAHPPMPQLR